MRGATLAFLFFWWQVQDGWELGVGGLERRD